MYNWDRKFLCNTLTVWYDRHTSRPGLDLWLDERNLQLCRAISLEYIREIFGIRYEMENYDDKNEYKIKDRSCGRLKDTWL